LKGHGGEPGNRFLHERTDMQEALDIVFDF
jgi:hypothetical protein